MSSSGMTSSHSFGSRLNSSNGSDGTPLSPTPSQSRLRMNKKSDKSEPEANDVIKLKKEVQKGVWIAEVNGHSMKINLSYVCPEKEKRRKDKKDKKKKGTKRETEEEEIRDDDLGEDEDDFVDLAPHPAVIPSDIRERLVSDVDALKKELAAARLELELMVRAYNEDFVTDPAEARKLPPALRIKRSPDEMMFEKMLDQPYLATVGFKKNTPDVTGKVVEVKSSEAKQLAQAETVSTVELALAPPSLFYYHNLLLPDFNLGAVSEVDLTNLTSLKLDAFAWLENDDVEYTRLLVMHMFRQLDLLESLRIDEIKLWRFLCTLSSRYRKVPFHNWYHAFNVTQTLFFFLTTCNAKVLLGPLECFSLLCATLCHDADHPGLNNTFHSKSNTRIALLHKKSTLENHHLLNGYAILSRPECNIAENLTVAERDQFTRYLRDLILSTDLSLHGIILRNMEERRKALAKQFSKSKPELSEEDKIVVMCCLIKCADLSNEIRPTDMAAKWAKLVITEFFAQSDKERELELPVTPFMDRDKIIVANEQINFISKLCMPLYKSLQGVFPAMIICLDQMNTNLANWNQRLGAFYAKDDLSSKSIWERDQVKDTKGKLADIFLKQSSPAAPGK